VLGIAQSSRYGRSHPFSGPCDSCRRCGVTRARDRRRVLFRPHGLVPTRSRSRSGRASARSRPGSPYPRGYEAPALQLAPGAGIRRKFGTKIRTGSLLVLVCRSARTTTKPPRGWLAARPGRRPFGQRRDPPWLSGCRRRCHHGNDPVSAERLGFAGTVAASAAHPSGRSPTLQRRRQGHRNRTPVYDQDDQQPRADGDGGVSATAVRGVIRSP
jgi:hypothetical protein